MKSLKHRVAIGSINLVNVALVTTVFIAGWFFYYAERIRTPFYFKGNWLVIALFLAVFVIFGRTYAAFFNPEIKLSEQIYSYALALLISDSLMYIVISLLMMRLSNLFIMLGIYLGQIFATAICCVVSHRWYFAVFPPLRSAIIYDKRQDKFEQLIQNYNLEKMFQIKFEVDIDECVHNLDMLQGIDTVFLSGVNSHDRNTILKYCVDKGITVHMTPSVGDLIMSGAKKVNIFHLLVLRVDGYSPSPIYLAAKRIFDVSISSLALLLLFPVFLITAIAIKATDGGPIFYTQERLTKNGKKFMIHKFRSMRVDAEKDGVARLSTGENDDRITPVGRIIRKVRIDELPQLFDILVGNLSIVGPRPERPEIARQYEEEIPEFRLRLQAKAGLTGYAQVYGKYNTAPYDKLQMDLMYIAHPSFFEDLRICFATIKILFMPESTEGIREGHVLASVESADK